MGKNKHFENHLLIAMPSLHDSNFSRSVVYLFEHSEQGALGMIINKPLQIQLVNVMEHLGILEVNPEVAKLPVFSGGPVGQEHGFIIHRDPKNKTLAVSASKEMLENIAKNQGPEKFIVTLGYSGWGAQQLDQEIARNDWLVAPATDTIVFDTPVHERWQRAAESLGVDLKKLSGQSGHA